MAATPNTMTTVATKSRGRRFRNEAPHLFWRGGLSGIHREPFQKDNAQLHSATRLTR
jgi:hypothetical protein